MTDAVGLGEWLQYIQTGRWGREGEPPPSVHFPSEQLRDEYLATAPERSDAEVKNLLRKFLVRSGTYFADRVYLESALQAAKSGDRSLVSLLGKREFGKRLIRWGARKEVAAWEGITWILDLVPDQPEEALRVLSNFYAVHAQELPDPLHASFSDAAALIRSCWIDVGATSEDALQVLHGLSDRDFEKLTAALWEKLGYDTEVTPPQRDGGWDVTATQTALGHRITVIIECKKWTAKKVGVEIVDRLAGVMNMERKSHGVLVTTSEFTAGARRKERGEPRIELIDGLTFVDMMNDKFGPRWTSRIEYLIQRK
ncbi:MULTISPECIES: restriction endonuclease [Streptomyces]|jgi:restriction system protein|uniref:restriction endonuclease n=1 Tax=Streptomyces TaxID=1883 RepID=UPI00340DCD15